MGAKPAPALAKLEAVALREIWGDEARDFTPWLATEGLSLLGDVIGVQLELISTEVAVGPYSADIVAQYVGRADHKVIIENQLGKTDHDHLGKLITYAAGMEARTLVWISDGFCPEHRQALDWLNANTGELVDCFGLEIRAFRIEKSNPALQFRVVCSPNRWTKSIREAGLTEEKLAALAKKRGVSEIVERILVSCGGRPDDCVTPEPSGSYGGSYWCYRRNSNNASRMVLGINVSGARKRTPDGQLDMWINMPYLSEVLGKSEEEVRNFCKKLPVLDMGKQDCIIRLKSVQDAMTVGTTLRRFFEENPGIYANRP